MADPENSISSFTNRNKYAQTTLQEILKVAVVCEKICQVDRSDLYTIQNPYGSDPTVVVTGLTGTYDVAALTTTNDALTVSEEVKASEHIYRHNQVLSNFDLFASRIDALTYGIAKAVDKYVLNMITEAGTGTYTTPSGGFTTAANIPTILANLGSKFAGYADVYKGLFLVIEASDTVGFTIAQMTNGYSYADSALNNGFMKSMGGFDIYVVADSTFTTVASADTTSGTQTWSNSGHRVAGVKGISTYAQPRGIEYQEKPVSGRTGVEMVLSCVIGAKVWYQKAALIVDITITA